VAWWQIAGLALGGLVACLNFHLSFLAAPLHRLRHGTPPGRVPSGIPLVGSLLLGAVAWALPLGSSAQVAALALLALDTGGPHWFVASQAWEAIQRRRGR
jgi:hypothetical protein